ncbi:hypothetical protein RJ640_007186 [Escallonia rubra]|uniref:UBN2_3 domain-containing protein n=1 Tax=Escallonia rubra TaxID=112253 RepID=A0AA88QZ06_9ASTE|nr:hypothetical protein RJ640_007186 [Escallonia rubra]
MRSFIKGKKLWRYLTGDIIIPVKTTNEPQLKFDERLDDWDSKNHQIITWFRNTSVPSIYQQFCRYNTAKEIWDLLAQRYTTTYLAHQYQLHDSFHRMKQEPGQSINSFLSQKQGIWDQLELSEPSWTCSEDSSHFIVYRDHLRLIQLCRKIDTGHFPQDCPRNPEKWSKNPTSTSAPPKPGLQSRFKPPSHSAADDDDVLNDSSSSALSDPETGQTIGIDRKVGRFVSFFTNSSVPLFYDSDETHIPPSDDFTAPPEMSARLADPVTPDQGPPYVSEDSTSMPI